MIHQDSNDMVYMICAMFPLIAGLFCIGAGVCELDSGCMWVVEYFCCC